MAFSHDQLADRVAPGDNALLRCPPFETAKDAGCRSLLTPDSPETENVLCVSLTRSPADYVTHWRQHVDATPAEAVIVNVDADSDTASMDGETQELPSCSSLTVDHVASPTNLTTIGTRLTEYLATWAEETPDRQSVFCFESVTALLQYTTLDQTVRFLDAVTDKVADYDAIGHYHVDPGALDPQTAQRLGTVFDDRWQFQDGEWDDPDTDSRPHLA